MQSTELQMGLKMKNGNRIERLANERRPHLASLFVPPGVREVHEIAHRFKSEADRMSAILGAGHNIDAIEILYAEKVLRVSHHGVVDWVAVVATGDDYRKRNNDALNAFSLKLRTTYLDERPMLYGDELRSLPYPTWWRRAWAWLRRWWAL